MKNFIEICSLGWKTLREQNLIYSTNSFAIVPEGKEYLWSRPTWVTSSRLIYRELNEGCKGRFRSWPLSKEPHILQKLWETWTLDGDELLLSVVGDPPQTLTAPRSWTELPSSSLAKDRGRKSDLTWHVVGTKPQLRTRSAGKGIQHSYH